MPLEKTVTGRTFGETFPGLKLDDKIRVLMESVRVERVIVNQTRTRLRVLIVSENWLKKKHLRKAEAAMAEQLFAGREIDVRFIERFELSSAWTPALFYEAYRSSMEYELREADPLLYQTFAHAEISFSGDGVKVTIPANPVYRLRSDRLSAYFEKVFIERAGFSGLGIDIEEAAADTSPSAAEDDEYEALLREKMKRAAGAREGSGAKAEKDGGKAGGKEAGPSAGQEKGAPKKLKGPETGRFTRKAVLAKGEDVVLGRNFDDEPVPIAELGEDPRTVTIRGEVFSFESKETRSGRIMISAALTDYTDSLRIKLWCDPEELSDYEEVFRPGAAFVVKGFMDLDPYDREIVIKSALGIRRAGSLKERRTDNEPVKRVELHCHTKMSDMDAVSSAADIIKQAYGFGMKAIAITDHGVVQAFPEAYKTIGGKGGIPKDADMKIIYGMEAYLVDDMRHLVSGALTGRVQDEAVVFATVTTGQSPLVHDLIELAAVRVKDGKAVDEFSVLIRPLKPIPFSIQRETGITDEMAAGGVSEEEAVRRFADFAGGLPLIAYDADQEMNFILAAFEKYGISRQGSTVADIPSIVRFLVPDISRIRFRTLIRHLKVDCADEMRARPRAASLALVWKNLLGRMEQRGIGTFADLNEQGAFSVDRIRNLRYYHAIILAKNETGRRNLYTLVSESHLKYFKMRPRIPRSLLNKYREGLILGSACSAGELYASLLSGATDAEIARIVSWYDYLEIQPVANNAYLIGEARSGISSEEDLRNINRRIVKLGELFDKPVCATCDVHFLNPEDAVYRAIIQAGHGFKEEEGGQPPLFLRTTREMLDEFAYLGEEKCREVVIESPNLVADMVEKISPIYPDKCPPSIPNSDEDLHDICYSTARKWYGDPLPEQVSSRLEKELISIISNGYAVMYIIAQKLVEKSNSDGYIVGSRGSVGSSFAATMAGITEVNPLPPHYRCGNCLYSDFESENPVEAHRSGLCGVDMPDKICPKCGAPLIKDGFDIPFETFLGFKGDKEPDIDLNFSGEEQSIAQAYTEVIFGKGQTFKAGTIGTVAEKTAFGYARKYYEEMGVTKRNCEIERLAAGCVGVRRTTGQHPGGVIVLPKGMDINWFTPIQHPANDMSSPLITTHFDYHSIDSNLLKLDILGHDDPTIIRMLGDLTGTDPLRVPLDDKGVISLFTGTDALKIKPEDIDGCRVGTLGVPEFGTNFVTNLLQDTSPVNFSELVRISGLSHGTNVWKGNAQEFILNGDCTLGSAICTRDDIMLDLIVWGMEPERSFKIMEAVRKGKGLTPDDEDEMRAHGVPDWYIESCQRIKYMFPKAHAVAYVMNAFRIAYYKINYPLAYYAAFFSVRAKTFDYERMCMGRSQLEYYADEIRKNPSPSAKEEEEFDDMKLVREMYARGYEFMPLDIYRAKASRCQIIDGKIMPPLNSVSGLGDTQAALIEAEAAKEPFLSVDDFRQRTRASRTIVDLLESLGVLKGLPESNQISLFDLMGQGAS